MSKENYLHQGDHVELVDDADTGKLSVDVRAVGRGLINYQAVYVTNDKAPNRKTGRIEIAGPDGLQTAELEQTSASSVSGWDSAVQRFYRKTTYIVTKTTMDYTKMPGKYVSNGVKPGPKSGQHVDPPEGLIAPEAKPPAIGTMLKLNRSLGGGLKYVPTDSLSDPTLLESVEVNNDGCLISIEAFHSQAKFEAHLQLGRFNNARVYLIHESMKGGRWRYILSCSLHSWDVIKDLSNDPVNVFMHYRVDGIISAQRVHQVPGGHVNKHSMTIPDQHPEKMLDYGKESKLGMEYDLPGKLLVIKEGKLSPEGTALVDDLLKKIKKNDLLSKKAQEVVAKKKEAAKAKFEELQKAKKSVGIEWNEFMDELEPVFQDEAKKKADADALKKAKSALALHKKGLISKASLFETVFGKLFGADKDSGEPEEEKSKAEPQPKGRKVILD